MLFPLLTAEITRQAKRQGGADMERAAGKRRVRAPLQHQVGKTWYSATVGDEEPDQEHGGTPSPDLSAEAMRELLGSESTFWEMFDRSLKHSTASNMAYEANNARALQVVS